MTEEYGYQGEAWHKQEWDTPKSYLAFQEYLMMPPTERSIDKTAKVTGKSVSQVNNWCTKYQWVERVHKYDTHIGLKRLNEFESKQKDALEKYVEHSIALHQNSLAASARLLQIVNKKLNAMIASGEEIEAKLIPSYLTAAVKAAEKAETSQAHLLGVYQILAHIDDSVDP